MAKIRDCHYTIPQCCYTIGCVITLYPCVVIPYPCVVIPYTAAVSLRPVPLCCCQYGRWCCCVRGRPAAAVCPLRSSSLRQVGHDGSCSSQRRRHVLGSGWRQRGRYGGTLTIVAAKQLWRQSTGNVSTWLMIRPILRNKQLQHPQSQITITHNGSMFSVFKIPIWCFKAFQILQLRHITDLLVNEMSD